jgi:hypothetical protein
MITRKRTEPSAPAAAEQSEDQAAEVIADPVTDVEQLPDVLTDDATFDEPELLDGDATAEEIADTALRYCQIAEAHAEAAECDQAQHDDLTDQFEADLAACRAKYETKAQPIAGSRAEHLRQGTRIAETIRRLGNAKQLAAKAEASEAGVRALEDERAGLLDRQRDLGQRHDQRQAERGVLEAQLAAATEAADSAEMTKLRGELESTRSIEANLRAKLTDVLADLNKIGNGELQPVWPQKLLCEARRNAAAARRSAVDALNYALPARPEAVAARERQYEQELDRFESQRLAERAAEDKRQPPHQVVML